jgi:hypothetical protein
MTSVEIKQTLQDKGKFEFQISQQKTMCLLHNKGRYSYKIQGFEIGITGEQLDGLLLRLPSNVGAVGTK